MIFYIGRSVTHAHKKVCSGHNRLTQCFVVTGFHVKLKKKMKPKHCRLNFGRRTKNRVKTKRIRVDANKVTVGIVNSIKESLTEPTE